MYSTIHTEIKWSCIAVNGTPIQLQCVVWDHTVLAATRHKWTSPALTPARQVGTRFTYRRGMEGW